MVFLEGVYRFPEVWRAESTFSKNSLIQSIIVLFLKWFIAIPMGRKARVLSRGHPIQKGCNPFSYSCFNKIITTKAAGQVLDWICNLALDMMSMYWHKTKKRITLPENKSSLDRNANLLLELHSAFPAGNESRLDELSSWQMLPNERRSHPNRKCTTSVAQQLRAH